VRPATAKCPIRAIEDVPKIGAVPGTVREDELRLARKVLGRFDQTIDFSKYHDTYEEALRKMIQAKIAGEEIVEAEVERPAGVVNLMDALRKSLERAAQPESRRAAPPARRRPARARASRATRTAKVARFPVRKHA
jgi:DNA end-binding protein Ku